jgi:hypothetical protein
VKIQGTWYRSLRETDQGAIAIIDQRWLPTKPWPAKDNGVPF